MCGDRLHDVTRPKSLLLECEGGGVRATPAAGHLPPSPGAPEGDQPPPLPPRGVDHPTSDTLRILESLEHHSNVITRGNTVPRDFLFYPSISTELPPAGWRSTSESPIIAHTPQHGGGLSWLKILPWYGRSQVLTMFNSSPPGLPRLLGCGFFHKYGLHLYDCASLVHPGSHWRCY